MEASVNEIIKKNREIIFSYFFDINRRRTFLGPIISQARIQHSQNEIRKFFCLLKNNSIESSGEFKFIFHPEGEKRDLDSIIELSPIIIENRQQYGHSHLTKYESFLEDEYIKRVLQKNYFLYNIYVMSNDHGCIILDDISKCSLDRMISDELPPSIVVQTSEDNYQCYLFSRAYFDLKPAVKRRSLRSQLQREYNCDAGDLLNLPCGRLPGFLNVKGKTSFVDEKVNEVCILDEYSRNSPCARLDANISRIISSI